jgi:hypothetical protein
MEASAPIPSYYRHAGVRRRILEFLGGDHVGNLTCRYITTDDASASRRRPQPVESLLPSLDREVEIARSLWDRKSLIADLDIEYVNFDSPSEPYLDPLRTFELQAPVARETERLLAECGIEFLHTLTGRGHHYTWRMPLGSGVVRQLEELGLEVAAAGDAAADSPGSDVAPVPSALHAAFLGLGLVVEFLACEIRHRAAGSCAVPVELTAVEAGPSGHGREIVSIDISEYGDPLPARAVRVPFSAYLKPRQYRPPEDPAWRLPPIFAVPLAGMSVAEGIRTMRDARLAARLAGRASAAIPPAEEGMARLLGHYRASALRRFHTWFYSHRQHTPAEWPGTYDLMAMDRLPTCAQHVLTRPNDALLTPSGMRLVTRVLLALGWHPRHIAGMIRSKFERDHGWGDQWQGYDPALRADFYTRIFAGPFATRLDDLLDFNCRSSQEEKTCPAIHCPWNLEPFRESALARRRYEYLAHRPFNRLFLPTKHL